MTSRTDTARTATDSGPALDPQRGAPSCSSTRSSSQTRSGGDNLFTDRLVDLVAFARTHGATTAVYDVGSLDLIRRYNNITFDATKRITHFEEKPAHPQGTMTGICVYYYPRQTIPLIEQYVREGNNPDQPGRLVAWLYTRQPMFVHPIEGKWIDVGTPDQLDEANRAFS